MLPRYTTPQKESYMTKAIKQACIILVAGTILVSLLSLAIPPAPVSVNTRTQLTAPRPQITTNSNGLRANRKRGGVRSQSQVRTANKKLDDNRPQGQHHHWDADTLEQDGNILADIEGASSEDSPSKQQLAAEIESETKKENAAADGVFGRTKDGEAHADDTKKQSVDTPKAVKVGHVDIDALDAKNKAIHDDNAKANTDKKTITIDVNDGDVIPDEKKDGSKAGGDRNVHSAKDEESEKNSAKLPETGASKNDEVEEKKDAPVKIEALDSKIKNIVRLNEGAESTSFVDKAAGGDVSVDKNKAQSSAEIKEEVSKEEDNDVKLEKEPKDKEGDAVKSGDASEIDGNGITDRGAADGSNLEAKDKAANGVKASNNDADESVGEGAKRSESKDAEEDALKMDGDSIKGDSQVNSKTAEPDSTVRERKRIARANVDEPSDTREGREHRKGAAPKLSQRDKISANLA